MLKSQVDSRQQAQGEVQSCSMNQTLNDSTFDDAFCIGRTTEITAQRHETVYRNTGITTNTQASESEIAIQLEAAAAAAEAEKAAEEAYGAAAEEGYLERTANLEKMRYLTFMATYSRQNMEVVRGLKPEQAQEQIRVFRAATEIVKLEAIAARDRAAANSAEAGNKGRLEGLATASEANLVEARRKANQDFRVSQELEKQAQARLKFGAQDFAALQAAEKQQQALAKERKLKEAAAAAAAQAQMDAQLTAALSTEIAQLKATIQINVNAEAAAATELAKANQTLAQQSQEQAKADGELAAATALANAAAAAAAAAKSGQQAAAAAAAALASANAQLVTMRQKARDAAAALAATQRIIQEKEAAKAAAAAAIASQTQNKAAKQSELEGISARVKARHDAERAAGIRTN